MRKLIFETEGGKLTIEMPIDANLDEWGNAFKSILVFESFDGKQVEELIHNYQYEGEIYL